MATESVATVTRPADVGLKREMGLIGATWASETSIIGSGWLFGSLFAAQAAGTGALLGWVIGGAAVIVLALVHAELGGMYPVSGGTARFPHFAFGSVAGISFGFFSFVQAITVAPIECYAVMQYLSYYWHGIYAVPVFAIIVLLFKFHGSNFGAGGGFMPYGIKALFAAIPSAGIIFAYLGFEQADQLAGEIKDPQRNLPRAIILAVLIGVTIYVMLQVAFIGALPGSGLPRLVPRQPQQAKGGKRRPLWAP